MMLRTASLRRNHSHRCFVRSRAKQTFFLLICVAFGDLALTAGAEPAPKKGKTLYVSKLGDNSDGSSWAKAFRTIQGALHAVPDETGGYRIVIRPDTYMEANLFPAHKGAAGAYNQLVGDVDGKLGSGTAGWVVIDSGDPNKGFKSYDWWGPIRSYQKGWSKEHKDTTFSALGWDRWVVRHLYVTGGDAGLFWDLTDKSGSPFTVVVEDCVSIGRAFGGGFAGPVARKDEPIVFRRCTLMCLDRWGDAGGVYVRAHNKTMPTTADVLFEECTLVGPDNALQVGNPGFDVFTRVELKKCGLIVLNFSQPHGTPSTGIINSRIKGEHLHVDFEDCTLMGYQVFGTGMEGKYDGKITYTTTGSVNAYVQYQQSVPDGFFRLGHWPVELFGKILPPRPTRRRSGLAEEGIKLRDMCEVAPFVWNDRLHLLEAVRPGSGGKLEEYYLTITDVETDKQVARFAQGYGLASAIVHDGSVYVFASRFDPKTSWTDVTVFSSADLNTWNKKRVIEQQPNEHLFNSSVCRGPDGFVMAYESNDPTYPAFTVKFAHSKDLRTWTKLPDAVFGRDRYTACPCIRYADGWYYMLYLERRSPRWFFETWLARSKDLETWTLSPANPVVTPELLSESINASDPDIVEFAGKTYLYFSVGDQRTWMNTKRSVYPGPMNEFFAGYFEGQGLPTR